MSADYIFRIGDFSTVKILMKAFTSSPENEKYLIGRTIETTLEDLREFWLSEPEKPT